MRPRRRSCSEVNLVGRVKSTARMRRRRCGAGFSSGSRPSRAASTSAAIASGSGPGRSCRDLHAAGHEDLLGAAGLAHGHASRVDVDADRAAALAAGLGGDRRDPQRPRAGRARRPRCAGRPRAWRWPANISRRRPARRRAAARRPPAAHDRSISAGTATSANLTGRRRVAAAGGQHDVGQPGDAEPASSSARPMHEPRPRDTSTSPATAEAASSPMRTIVSAIATDPGRASSWSTPPASGTSRNETEQSSPSTTSSESSSSATSPAPARSASTVCDDRAEHVGGRRRRRRLERHAGHRRERADVGGADDVADLSQRRLADLGAGLDAEHPAHLRRRRRAGRAAGRSRPCRRRRRARRRSPRPRGRRRLDGVGQRQHAGARHRDVDAAAEHARQRRAGRAGADVRQLAQGVELQIACTGSTEWSFQAQAETGTSTTASQSTIRAIWPSESTAAPDRAAPSATSGGSGRVTSSRWPTSRTTASAKRSVAAADDDGVLGVGVARPAVALGGVDDRQHAVGEDQHPPAGDRAHGLVGEAHGALDAVERDRERAAVGLDEQRGHDRQRQRQADLGGRAAGRARRSSGPRRRARGSWRARRPCRRRGRRCRS